MQKKKKALTWQQYIEYNINLAGISNQTEHGGHAAQLN